MSETLVSVGVEYRNRDYAGVTARVNGFVDYDDVRYVSYGVYAHGEYIGRYERRLARFLEIYVTHKAGGGKSV